MQKKEYQILARRYRPQTFHEVIGQEATVTTLKNAIRNERLAQAYLFSGSRGTGKTTLARVLAKALNCAEPSTDNEPCCRCPSCFAIAKGTSLDVLEIDGASHRGIEDIRRINETVTFAPSSGRYKIYIIDEVHMLTKEAFNALLKTLEEPPQNVKFFFATTEPHKVLPTILSRCQRFSLRRIPTQQIVFKLEKIAQEIGVRVTEEALQHIAQRAEGGLRDAESLFDQIIAFQEGEITLDTIHDVLGSVPRDRFLALEKAAKEGNMGFAFELAQQIYEEGKDLPYFVDTLIEHYRSLLLIHLSGPNTALTPLSEEERRQYADIAREYSREQLTTILDDLFGVASQIRTLPSGQMAVEIVLLRLLRNRYRLPIDLLVQRVAEMEKRIEEKAVAPPPIPAVSPLPEPEETTPVTLGARPTAEAEQEKRERTGWHDTVLEFAAVELGGSLEKKNRR